MLSRFFSPPDQDWPREPPFDPIIMIEDDMEKKLQEVKLLGR